MKSLAVLGIAVALAAVSIPQAGAQEVMGSTAVTGAGSTFAYPILSKWAESYQRWVAGGGEYATTGAGLDDPPAGVALDYEPVGSLAGTMRVRDAAVDFGASDAPMKPDELAKLGLGQFPIVIGGVVAVVNIDGVAPGAIKFSGQVLADIFLGKVQSWADPAITALNPDLKLPDAPIAVVHRSDGSGTTFNFADYLSKASPEWQEKIGTDTLLSWPTGTGAKGNEGVAVAVSQTKNSIGYVEYSLAVKMGLSYAQVENRAGKFIEPSPQSFQAAAASALWSTAGDFYLMLTDAAGDDAYPIAATVFVLMHKQPNSPQGSRAALNFFQWSLEKGGNDAAELGYVPLPETLVKQIKEYWASTFKAST